MNRTERPASDDERAKDILAAACEKPRMDGMGVDNEDIQWAVQRRRERASLDATGDLEVSDVPVPAKNIAPGDDPDVTT